MADPIAGEWTYAAIGTEPFWSLDAHSTKGGGWSLHRPGEVAAYGSLDSVAAPAEPPTLTGRSSDGERFRLIASAGPCSDGMSERRFAHTVVVALGSLRLRGCGGDVLRPARLEGTSWRFVTLAGEALAAEQTELRFEDGRVIGGVGCNHYEKRVSWISDERLQGAPAIGTQMGCGPLAAREEAFARLLSGEMRLSFAADGTLTLTGGGVTATLKRVI